MRVSVAMATYNGEKYLAHQLESLVRQTRLPDELVISDDASFDSTWAIVTEFAARAPFPVRLYHNEHNLGFAQNFSRALSLCTGDLVFMCDQDDEWFEAKISETCKIFDTKKDVFCISTDAYVCDAQLRHESRTVLGDGIGLNGACTALRREFLDIALPVPLAARSHDGWIYNLSTGLCVRLAAPVVLQLWRRHDAAVSGTTELGFRERLGIRAALRPAELAAGLSGADDGEARDVGRRSTDGAPGRAPSVLAGRRPARRASARERDPPGAHGLLERRRARRALVAARWLATGRYRGSYGLRDAALDIATLRS